MTRGRREDRFQLFAWHGMQLWMPEDWNPGALIGNMRSGYCRLDGETEVCAELKWESVRRPPPISKVVEHYLKTGFGSRNKNLRPERVRRDTRLVNIPDAECECFEYRAGVDVIGLVARYAQSKRVYIAQAFCMPSGPPRRILKRFLGSYRETPPDQPIIWSAFGMRCALPEEYELRMHTFKPGRMEMRFQSHGASAQALRVGLAEMLLRGQSLRDWLRKEPLAKSWRLKVELNDTTFHAHPAVEVTGVHRRSLAGLITRSRVVRCLTWHCEPANAIYVAYWTGSRKAQDQFAAFANSFVCHSRDEGE